MNKRYFFTAGWALVAFGVVLTIFSPKIVFPGLERLLGIDTIVGRGNVSYQSDGSYVFTNPGAMAAWIVSVAGVGLLMSAFGVALLWLARRKLAS